MAVNAMPTATSRQASRSSGSMSPTTSLPIGHRCALTPRSGLDLRPLVFEQARMRGWALRELSRAHHSLEDIFVHITRPDREEETR